MAIQVIIQRKVKQGRQAKELVPLILQMRACAMYQPGYISFVSSTGFRPLIYGFPN